MNNHEQPTAPNNLSRRLFLGGGAAVVAGGGVFASKWFNIFADVSANGALSVEDAYAQAEAGDIYLIDIRRPDEWKKTGIAVPAIPLDMRRDDFETVLRTLFEKSGDRPVALICARGVRSDRMDTRLKEDGFANIIDVPEGMLGSGAGPGYLKADLPVRAPTAQELDGQVLLA
ncbi:MAG: rhodanese-like domain-containing protein [Tateyamaria sp.]|uniref:rhodanese-like domain-containing protein n=1 Tax=Tateyamaria sp. TaxID=1929288 RepID=UPI00326C131E